MAGVSEGGLRTVVGEEFCAEYLFLFVTKKERLEDAHISHEQ